MGTGTGILMVVAANLGASLVVGLDRLPFAAAAARDNLLHNGIDTEKMAVFSAADVKVIKSRFDLVAINILPEAIVALLPDVAKVVEPNGTLILSGMIQGNTHRVNEQLRQCDFAPVKAYRRGLWVGLAAQFSPPVDPLHRFDEPGRSLKHHVDQQRS